MYTTPIPGCILGNLGLGRRLGFVGLELWQEEGRWEKYEQASKLGPQLGDGAGQHRTTGQEGAELYNQCDGNRRTRELEGQEQRAGTTSEMLEFVVSKLIEFTNGSTMPLGLGSK